MIAVQFPEPQFKIKREGEKRFIFDGLRKAWLPLTEEEWVRQNFVAYLITVLNYPASFIALEKEILLNGLKKRFDILVHNKAHQPWMLVECKAPHINVNENVLQQALRYNQTVPVKFIVLTNGKATVGWENNGARLQPLTALPVFPTHL